MRIKEYENKGMCAEKNKRIHKQLNKYNYAKTKE